MKFLPVIFALLLPVALPAQEKPAATPAPIPIPIKMGGTKETAAKMLAIIIPRVEFRVATLRESIDWIQRKSVELEITDDHPERRGVSVFVKLEPSSAPLPAPVSATPVPAELKITLITLSCNNLTLYDVFRYVAEAGGVRITLDPVMAVLPSSGPLPRAIKGTDLPPIPPGQTEDQYLAANRDFLAKLPLDEPASPTGEKNPAKQNTRSLVHLLFKTRHIILPKVDLKDVTINAAIEFLRTQSSALDTPEKDLVKKGVSMVLFFPPTIDPAVAPAPPRITLSLTGTSLEKTIEQVAAAAGMQVRIDPHAVVFFPSPAKP